MGSFRSADTRVHDQAVLTAADRPEWLSELDPSGRPNWLGDGESITYWTRLPHGAARRIATAASPTVVDERGRMHGSYDVGAATMAQLREGIVDWTVFDEHGLKVAWDARRAEELIDGLPLPVITELGERIGRDEPPLVAEGEQSPNA